MLPYRDKIIVSDNIFSEAECNQLIDYFKDNQSKTKQFLNTHYLDLASASRSIAIDAVLRIQNEAHLLLGRGFIVDWAHLVNYPAGADNPTHTDTASDQTILTSITYLNDSYSGGNTYIKDDIIFKPQTGRTLFFDGTSYEHGVSKVNSGSRYTLSIWYKRI